MIGPASSSNELSTSSTVAARPAFLHGFELLPPLLGTTTLKIYDNDTAASGRIMAEATCAAGQNSVFVTFLSPRVCNQGIYAALSGSASTFVVAFSLG